MAFETGLLFDNRYTLIEKIGIGGFSEVWKAKDTFSDGLQIALKIYAPDKGMDSQGIHQFKKEYTLMLDIRHQNILTASHFSIYNERPYLVLPFCEGGSLHNLIYTKETLSEIEIANVLLQVGEGLAYLHAQNIIHQDLKPDNVLIDKKGNYLLTDFGISSRLRSTLRKSTQSSKALTAAYGPPERFSAHQLSHYNGDVFSLGVMIYEMATGDVPWMGMGGSVVRADTELPELPNHYSRSLNRLMHRCMSFNPDERIGAKELADVSRFFVNNEYWGSEKRSATSLEHKTNEMDPLFKELEGRKTERLKSEALKQAVEPKPIANKEFKEKEARLYFHSIKNWMDNRIVMAFGLSVWCFTVFILVAFLVAVFSEGGSQDGDDVLIVFSLLYGCLYVLGFLLFSIRNVRLKVIVGLVCLIPIFGMGTVLGFDNAALSGFVQILLSVMVFIGFASTLYWLVFWILWLKEKFAKVKN